MNLRIGVGIVFALASIATAGDVEDRLAAILKQLDADDVAAREEASKDLDAWCDVAGSRAESLLRKAEPGLPLEAAARVRRQLVHFERVAEARKAVGMFDALELPSAKGHRFVKFNTGQYVLRDEGRLSFTIVEGWLIRESETDVEIANEDGSHVLLRNRKLPEEWEKYKAKHPARQPLPGELGEQDFAALCETLLTSNSESGFSGQFSGTKTHAIYARWALERGMDRTGLRLLERAREDALRQRREQEDKRSADELIVTGVAETLKYQAITTAHAGSPRKDVLEIWKSIAALPPNSYSEKARRFVQAYGSLIEEDAAFVEKSAEELASSSPTAQAEYWLHKLRDLDAEQMMQPGSVSVFWGGKEGQPNPAEKLRDLKDDAIPVLIEHLDDARPTRSMGYWRNFAPDSYYLLTVGDTCEQVFSAITGQNLWEAATTSSTPARDGKAVDIKAAAREWWEKTRGMGEEERLLALLDTNPGRAARELLAKNESKYKPIILKWCVDHPEPSFYPLQELQGKIVAGDRESLESLLQAKSNEVVSMAARLLWRSCGASTGARALVPRLNDNSAGHSGGFWMESGMRLLAEVPEEFAEDALVEFIRSGQRGMRTTAVDSSARSSSGKIAAALAELLEDDSKTGSHCYSGGESWEPRYCDHAAQALDNLLGFTRDVSMSGSPKPDDARVERLTTWWKENGATFDWNTLAEKKKKPEK